MRRSISFEERKRDSTSMVSRYPGHVPVFVEKDECCQTLPDIHNNKFLVPKELSFHHFVYVVRKRVLLSNTTTIYVFIDKRIPNQFNSIGDLYNEYHDEDGFLYMTYSDENYDRLNRIKEILDNKATKFLNIFKRLPPFNTQTQNQDIDIESVII